MVGCEDGALVFLRRLPLPVTHETSVAVSDAAETAITAFENLTAALAAVVHDEAERRFVMVDAVERRRRFE